MGVSQIRGTILGVPQRRTIVFEGFIWGPLVLGNYQVWGSLLHVGVGLRDWMSKLIQTSCIDLYIYTHMHMNLFHHAFVHVCARKHMCSRAPEFTSLRGSWSEDPVTLELETLWTFELYSSGVLGGESGWDSCQQGLGSIGEG